MTYQEYLEECLFLKKCADRYYTLEEGQQLLIPNEEFDIRRKAVQDYENDKDIAEENRFSSSVGYSSNENRVAYSRPMQSLENALTEAEATRHWINKWAAKLGARTEVIAEWKFDGMATRLRYVDGKLAIALSRGDSEEGKDITVHALKYVPDTIKMMGVVEIDGETTMPKYLLADLNADGHDYANCRNAVAGALNRKEPAPFADSLEFYPYAAWFEDVELPTHHDAMNLVRDLGFDVHAGIATTVEDIQGTFDIMVGKYGDSFNFEIDGVVFKINSVELQKKLGATMHSPNWAFAYKRPPTIKECVLLSVEFQVGRSGEITPVGKITPTNLLGVVVTSVNLHNEQRMAERGTAIGNTYEIYRSGDVIPHLGRCLRVSADAKEIKFPEVCPSCGSALVKKGATYYCSTPETCQGVAIAKIVYAVGREALDVDGIGPVAVETLYTKGRIRCAADVLVLGADDLVETGVSLHVAQNLVSACRKAQYSPPERFIMSLSIPGVGKATARSIISTIFHLSELLEWKEADAIVKLKIPGIGPGTAAAIAEYFSDIDNYEFAKYLFGLSMVKIERADTTIYENITGRTFVFSGSFSKDKDDLEDLVTMRGGYVSSSVSARTDYLVYGPGTGEKYRKASLLKVPTLNESEFMRLITEAVKVTHF